ncbi:MAG TPA: hypothetical protein ENH91_02120 [Leeuwenhoekiella sp.]|nr:hypothetical protein [Leeuwenhoekiella sp.]
MGNQTYTRVTLSVFGEEKAQTKNISKRYQFYFVSRRKILDLSGTLSWILKIPLQETVFLEFFKIWFRHAEPVSASHLQQS